MWCECDRASTANVTMMRSGLDTSSDESSADEFDLLTPSSEEVNSGSGERRRRRKKPVNCCCRQVKRLEIIPGFKPAFETVGRCCCTCNMKFLVCCNIWSAFGMLILLFLGLVAFPTNELRLPDIDDPEEARISCLTAAAMYFLTFGGTLAKIIYDKDRSGGPRVRRKRKRWGNKLGESPSMYGQIATTEVAEDEDADENEGAHDSVRLSLSVLLLLQYVLNVNMFSSFGSFSRFPMCVCCPENIWDCLQLIAQVHRR